MTMDYGGSVLGDGVGPALHPQQWYEMMFTWDGTTLRASYREKGATQWLGDYTLYSSTTVYPTQLQIGQPDVLTYNSVQMTMLVDYWNQTPPTPAPAGNTVNDYIGASGAAADSTKWTTTTATFYDAGQGCLQAGHDPQDGNSHLKVFVNAKGFTTVPKPRPSCRP